MKKISIAVISFISITYCANSQVSNPEQQNNNGQNDKNITNAATSQKNTNETHWVIVAGMQNSRLSNAPTGFSQFQSNNNTTGSVWKPYFGINGFKKLGNGRFSFIEGLEYAIEGGKDDYGKITMDYINLHASIGYDLFDRTFIAAGLQWGQLLAAKYESDDIKKYLNDNQFSLLFSAKTNLTGNLYLDLRTRIGLTNISEGSDFKSNSQFIVGLSYKL